MAVQTGIARAVLAALAGFAAPALLAAFVVGDRPPDGAGTADGAQGPDGNRPPETCVILLHGLGRTPLSMLPLKFALDRAGYRTVNKGYPSLAQPIEELAATHVPEALARCASPPDAPIHFVGHSLGGILVRQYLQDHAVPAGSRMVMLGPPNRGSELVAEFADDVWFAVMGPAAAQLGTGADSLPANLGPVDLEIGIIAATRSGLDSILLQAAELPEPHDGKVSLESTRLDEMQDFLAVDETHTFVIGNAKVAEQVVAFLANGRFQPPDHAADSNVPDARTDLTDPTDADRPPDPPDPADPADPTDADRPADPADPTDADRPAHPTNPANPSAPANQQPAPADPTDSAHTP